MSRWTLSSQAAFAAAVTAALAGTAVSAATTDELDQRIRILERQLEIQKEEADTKAKDATAPSAGEKGFSLKKGDFELKFNLLAQADGRFFLDDSAAQRLSEGFLARRLRPTIQGSLGKLVSFRLTPEFAGNGAGLGGAGTTVATPAGSASPTASVGAANSSASIVDAYFDLKFHPAASLRIGKQKGPVGLERLQSGGAISFIERGYPTELVPNRDIGVALYGEVLNGTLSYTVGAFNGTADGRDIASTDSDNRRELAGRVFAEPFKNDPGFFQGLGFGIGATSGTQIGGSLPQYRSHGQNTFFSYNAAGAAANGRHSRYSPQFYWYRNQIGLLGEYASSRQEVTRTSGPTVDFTHTGYELTATYVLTGEDATFKGPVKPASPYAIGAEGWGALEVALRAGALEVDKDVFDAAAGGGTAFATGAVARQQKASSYGLGFNWYLTQNAKVVLDYNFTKFDAAPGSTATREDEKALFTRLQINY